MKSATFASIAATFLLIMAITIAALAQSGGAARPRYARPETAGLESQNPKPSSERDGGQEGQRPRTTTDESVTIKMDTTLVTIPVSVIDRAGRYVPRLTKQDFHIYEDGV